MVSLKLPFFILIGIVLLLLETLFFYSVFGPSIYDDFNVARAIVDWRTNPSPEKEANLQMAIRHLQTKKAILNGVLWILIVLNTVAIIQVGRKIKNIFVPCANNHIPTPKS